MSFGQVFVADVIGGFAGTIEVPGFHQYGATLPVDCILDTICLTVGNPAFSPAPDQTVHAFAMIATADGNSQQFTLHPATKAEVVFMEGVAYPVQVNTARETGLGFLLAAKTRCMIICGHYTSGEAGATSYAFSYSGTFSFK